MRRVDILVVAVAALVGLAFLHGPLALSGGERVPGDLLDLRFNNVVLEHAARWLGGAPGHEALFSPPWFWPHEGSLAYSDNLVGAMPLYALLRASGLDPVSALTAWTVAMTLASFGAALALARAFGMTMVGAAGCAFLFACGLPRGLQLTYHVQLMPHFATPLVVLALLRGRPVLAAVLAAWQVWCGVYLGFLLGLGAVLAATASLLWRPARAALLTYVRERARSLAAAALVGAALVLPLAPPYMAAARDAGGGRSSSYVSRFLPRPASYATPAGHTILYRALRPLGADLAFPVEQSLFAGFAPWACALALLTTAWRRSESPAGSPSPASPAVAPDADAPAAPAPALVAMVAVAPASALVTLHAGGLSLWLALVEAVPLIGAFRAVGRVGLLQLLALGLAVGWAATSLERRGRRGWALALVALVGIENAGFAPHLTSRSEILARGHAVRAALDAVPDATAFYLRAPEGATLEGIAITHLDAMWGAATTGRPTLNGYAATSPASWAPLFDARRAGPLEVCTWLASEGRDPATSPVAVLPAPPSPGRAP